MRGSCTEGILSLAQAAEQRSVTATHRCHLCSHTNATNRADKLWQQAPNRRGRCPVHGRQRHVPDALAGCAPSSDYRVFHSRPRWPYLFLPCHFAVLHCSIQGPCRCTAGLSSTLRAGQHASPARLCDHQAAAKAAVERGPSEMCCLPAGTAPSWHPLEIRG